MSDKVQIASIRLQEILAISLEAGNLQIARLAFRTLAELGAPDEQLPSQED